MRQLNITHVTEYNFSSPVSLNTHRLMLRPRENHTLRIIASTLSISPAHIIRWYRDALDNSIACVSFLVPSSHLRIESNVTLNLYQDAPLDFLMDDHAVFYPFEYSVEERPDLEVFRQCVYPGDMSVVSQWLQSLGCLQHNIETFSLLDRMNRGIASNFVYQAREAPGVQSPARTLAIRSGSCRDFAALFMEACRGLGLASRFVSGYLDISAKQDVNASTHAWAEVYLPGPGWKCFDPTCGVVTGDRHIPIAVARHPEAVPPVSGSFIGHYSQGPTPVVKVRVTEV